MNPEIEALEIVKEEISKLLGKYKPRAEKEREKLNNVFITVQGEKCYTEEEINDWYRCDYISCSQADKYIEKLEEKKKKAGLIGSNDTKSERICSILNVLSHNLTVEIKDLKNREEEKRKKQERWEIAQKQGCSYAEFLELEEISRQSEEYERMMNHDRHKQGTQGTK